MTRPSAPRVALRFASARTKRAGQTWYHLTDKANFKLNPKYAPEDNSLSIGDRSGRPGIYLGSDVERWVNGYGYWRPFVVEFDVDPTVKEDPGVHGRWGGEMFVPATSFDKISIKRVIPLDAWARENYGDFGWVEAFHLRRFDTGEPIETAGWGRMLNPPKGYRYPGPDVRQMPAGDVKRLKKDLRDFRKGRKASARKTAARGKTLWHITKDRNFRPDPDFRPVSGGGWDTARKPMLYATTSPFYWHGMSGGGEGPWTKGRAWAAELELLPGHPPVKWENPLRPQTILDPEFVRVKRVIPVEHAIAEETGYLGNEYVGGDYIYGKTAAPFVDEGMVGEDWGSSASGLLVTDGDRVLLLKRSPYVQDPGLWGIPGGAVPVDYDTGKRKDAKRSALDEAREEMGGIPSGSVVGKHVFRKPSGFTFTTFVWETDPDSLDRFAPRLNWEHTDWGLFDLDDIKPSGIHPGVIWVLKRMGR